MFYSSMNYFFNGIVKSSTDFSLRAISISFILLSFLLFVFWGSSISFKNFFAMFRSLIFSCSTYCFGFAFFSLGVTFLSYLIKFFSVFCFFVGLLFSFCLRSFSIRSFTFFAHILKSIFGCFISIKFRNRQKDLAFRTFLGTHNKYCTLTMRNSKGELCLM